VRSGGYNSACQPRVNLIQRRDAQHSRPDMPATSALVLVADRQRPDEARGSAPGGDQADAEKSIGCISGSFVNFRITSLSNEQL
jgi:hypothetical protein